MRTNRDKKSSTQSIEQKRVVVLHGPNLNLLGTREPEVYGRTTLADIHAAMESRARADGVLVESFQSNHEGQLIDRVQAAGSEGVAAEFRGDVVAVAKRDLAAGEILDGEGGFTVAGQLRPASVSVPMKALPLGLTGGVKMLRNVKADSVLVYGDVALDENVTAVKLRRQVEQGFFR